jgi:tetratricopeptide (TPR) repeat protein
MNHIGIGRSVLVFMPVVAFSFFFSSQREANAGSKVQENPDTYAQAALQNANLGRFDAAVDGYNHAIKLNKSNIQYYKMRANAEMGANQVKKAIADWSHVLSEQPQDSSTLAARAKAYDVIKDYGKEKKDLDKFLFFQPNSTTGLLLRATVNDRLGNSQEVLNDCNATLNSGGLPRDVLKEVYRLRAQAFQKLGLKIDAEQEMTKYRSLM